MMMMMMMMMMMIIIIIIIIIIIFREGMGYFRNNILQTDFEGKLSCKVNIIGKNSYPEKNFSHGL